MYLTRPTYLTEDVQKEKLRDRDFHENIKDHSEKIHEIEKSSEYLGKGI